MNMAISPLSDAVCELTFTRIEPEGTRIHAGAHVKKLDYGWEGRESFCLASLQSCRKYSKGRRAMVKNCVLIFLEEQWC
jgi:hypothetical protein